MFSASSTSFDLWVDLPLPNDFGSNNRNRNKNFQVELFPFKESTTEIGLCKNVSHGHIICCISLMAQTLVSDLERKSHGVLHCLPL